MDEGDPKAELASAETAAEVAKAIDAMSADLIRNVAKYPALLHDVPHLATAMEKSIKHGHLADAKMRANQLDKHLEVYSPTETPAQEAKFTLRKRVRLLAKITG